MLPSQIHLALNHFPIAGVFFALFFIALSFIKKNALYMKVAAMIVIISGLFMIPVYLTGEDVQREVSRKPMVSRYSIKLHEETAERAFVVMIISVITAAGYLYLAQKNHTHSTKVGYLYIFLNLALVWFILDTAHSGGKIRHDQLRFGGGTYSGSME